MKKNKPVKKLYNFNGHLVKIDVTRMVCPVCFGVFEDRLAITELESADDHHDHLSIIPVERSDERFTLLADDLDEYVIVAGHDIEMSWCTILKGETILALVGDEIEHHDTYLFEDNTDGVFLATTVTVDSFNQILYVGDDQQIVHPHNKAEMMLGPCDHCWQAANENWCEPNDGLMRPWALFQITFANWDSIIQIWKPISKGDNVDYKLDVEHNFQFKDGYWQRYAPKIHHLTFYADVISNNNYHRNVSLPFVVACDLSGGGVGYICPNRKHNIIEFAKLNTEAIEAALNNNSKCFHIAERLRKIICCSEEEKIVRRRCEEVLRKQPEVMLRIAGMLAEEGRIKINDLI